MRPTINFRLKNGDTILTTYDEIAIIKNIGKYGDELTILDRDVRIGEYMDETPCINSFIPTDELYDITKRVINYG